MTTREEAIQHFCKKNNMTEVEAALGLMNYISDLMMATVELEPAMFVQLQCIIDASESCHKQANTPNNKNPHFIFNGIADLYLDAAPEDELKVCEEESMKITVKCFEAFKKHQGKNNE